MDENAYPTKTVLTTASYEGEDMGKAFVNAITEEAKIIYEKVCKNPNPMVMSEEEAKQHTKAKNCYACGVEFGTYVKNAKGERDEATKCGDHCHITGKYRGAACNKCNLRMRVPNFIPVLFHNLEGYDSHLFVKSLGLTEGDIKCIPKTDERYISFSKMIPMGTELILKPNGELVKKEIFLELRFIDSLKFTLKSLDSLAKTLGDDQFETLTSQMIPLISKETDDGRKHNRIESLNLLKQKGVFPYEYMTDFSKLGATSLPPNEAFYSQLSGSGISDKDYTHAQKVWNAFNCNLKRNLENLQTHLRSLKRNLENLQTHLLQELNFNFSVIGITETKIRDNDFFDFNPNMENYKFEFVPTPLASGGVGMYIRDNLKYTVLEKCSNGAFQALWVETDFPDKSNIICGVIYRQHNSPESFETYFEDTLDRFSALRSNKYIYIMGDFNINLLNAQTCQYTQDFLLTLQSYALTPTIDKPTRVYNNSATLIDNIFVNKIENPILSGNIVSDISDHFSQFCIIQTYNKTKHSYQHQ